MTYTFARPLPTLFSHIQLTHLQWITASHDDDTEVPDSHGKQETRWKRCPLRTWRSRPITKRCIIALYGEYGRPHCSPNPSLNRRDSAPWSSSGCPRVQHFFKTETKGMRCNNTRMHQLVQGYQCPKRLNHLMINSSSQSLQLKA